MADRKDADAGAEAGNNNDGGEAAPATAEVMNNDLDSYFAAKKDEEAPKADEEAPKADEAPKAEEA